MELMSLFLCEYITISDKLDKKAEVHRSLKVEQERLV